MSKDEVVETVETEEAEVEDTAEVVEAVSCTICGKPLTDEESIARRMGPICAANANNGESIARLEAAARDEVPDDYVKLEEAVQLCSELGIPISRLVKAMGGDKLAHEPEKAFWPVYVGARRMRFLPKAALAEIPSLLEKGSDAPKPKRKTKAKAKPKTKKAPAKKEEPEAKPTATAKQYEVVAPNYGGIEVGTITTLRELKAAYRKEVGAALKLTRRTKDGSTVYVDATNDQVVLKAID